MQGVTMSDFEPKKVNNYLEIIFILTTAQNYTSDFSDTLVGPDYCISSKADPTALSNQTYFENISNFW